MTDTRAERAPAAINPDSVAVAHGEAMLAERARAEQDHDRYASYAAVGVEPGSTTG